MSVLKTMKFKKIVVLESIRLCSMCSYLVRVYSGVLDSYTLKLTDMHRIIVRMYIQSCSQLATCMECNIVTPAVGVSQYKFFHVICHRII